MPSRTSLAEAIAGHPDLVGRTGVVERGIADAASQLVGGESYAVAPKRYHKNPVAWMVERMHVPERLLRWSLFPQYKKHTWDGDKDPLVQILEGLANWEDVGVESATGTGKTFLAALIALWFLDCFDRAIVVTAAPKEKQLELHMWKEIGKLWPRFSSYRPMAQLTHLKLRIIPRSEEWAATGFPVGVGANEESATKAQGFHAEHMLIITEETPGIHHATMTAFENTSQAPHNLRLALGNPDHAQDTLHKFCIEPKVKAIRISALDHPNVVLDNPSIVPGAISAERVERRRQKYGEDSPLYLSRYRGICPTDAVDALIRLRWLIAARDRTDKKDLATGMAALGVDVANSAEGDFASIAEGQGAVLDKVESFRCPDANQFARLHVASRIGKHLAASRVGVDAVGVGAGAVNELRRLNHLVLAIMSGSSAVAIKDQEEEFANLRSQMWWQFRMDAQHGELGLPDDEELFADLTTPKWGTRGGKIFVESKEDLVKRLGRSPDKGDAAVYWNWARQPELWRRPKPRIQPTVSRRSLR